MVKIAHAAWCLVGLGFAIYGTVSLVNAQAVSTKKVSCSILSRSGPTRAKKGTVTSCHYKVSISETPGRTWDVSKGSGCGLLGTGTDCPCSDIDCFVNRDSDGQISQVLSEGGAGGGGWNILGAWAALICGTCCGILPPLCETALSWNKQQDGASSASSESEGFMK
eukprot:TRINITY_DN95040_c0_g1_i1.p1 TRINITY_DN95040_c0_g1~~TRINITY_DN95040_c0_g1_i1.p1  ORF type:complete len:174 (-),score=20.34 TRINITY_DN95040_c0_g1_i1:35-532(-)